MEVNCALSNVGHVKEGGGRRHPLIPLRGTSLNTAENIDQGHA